MKTRVMAMYLPQFHVFEENSAWWGEGFTDWNAVRASRALFPGHEQPRLPLNGDYYDLTDPAVIGRQAALARKYGVDGFCIYHYWSRGRMLMEKPLELLRDTPDIDIDYFISWANHDFRKTWFGGDGRMLWPQEYGGEEDWQAHYHYLASFFRDPRYVKIHGCPVVMIYRPHQISDFSGMVDCWNRLAREDGFEGVYLIASMCYTGITSRQLQKLPGVKAAFIFEPMNVRTNGQGEKWLYMTLRRLKTAALGLWNKVFSKPLLEKFDYRAANEMMLRRERCGKQFYCAFPSWDNTPRYGGRGIAFTGSTPALFGHYARRLYQRSKEEGNEFFFINAWNEWGESAHLEPDERHGYAYLEALKEAVHD